MLSIIRLKKSIFLLLLHSLIMILCYNNLYSSELKEIKVRIFYLIKLNKLIFNGKTDSIRLFLDRSHQTPLEWVNLKQVEVNLFSQGSIEIKASDKILYMGQCRTITIRSSSNNIIEVGNNLISPRPYSGYFKILIQNNRLICINIVSLIHYINSVVGSELGSSNPSIDTLKAQSVVSRSYTLYSLDQIDQSSDYHFTDTTKSQVYLGMKNVNERVTKAVQETSNEVLTHQNNIIPAYYHSTCGGTTSSPKYIWKLKNQNYIVGIKDVDKKGHPYCSQSPHFKWRTLIKKKNLLSIFFRPFQSDQSMNLSDWYYDPSGRVYQLTIGTMNGSKRLTGEQFRIFIGRNLGWNKIKSTYITNYQDFGDRYLFEGKGLGHGLGLCQHGALKMGDLGIDYKSILKHYFPLCNITKE